MEKIATNNEAEIRETGNGVTEGDEQHPHTFVHDDDKQDEKLNEEKKLEVEKLYKEWT